MGAVPHQTSSAPTRFTRSLRIRCPASLPAAIDTAAARNLMTASEYIRQSIVAQLKADSIELIAERRRSGVLRAEEIEPQQATPGVAPRLHSGSRGNRVCCSAFGPSA